MIKSFIKNKMMQEDEEDLDDDQLAAKAHAVGLKGV